MKYNFKKNLIIILILISSVFTIYEFIENDKISINDIQDQNSNHTINNNEDDLNDITFTKAFVNRIVDGDTIEVTIEEKKYKVRFIGINCPEYTTKIEEYGKEATEYTTSMLLNKTVYLEKDVNETDKYGRLLRYIWLEIPNGINNEEISRKMFNAKLLLDGYAQVATYPPDVKYVDYFKSMQSEAKNNNVGLWK